MDPTPANFTGLDFQIDEAATLAGYLAAGFSKTVVGTYGGEQYPGVTRFMDGSTRESASTTTGRRPPRSSSAGMP